MDKTLNVQTVAEAWTALTDQIGEIRSINSEDDCQRAVSLLDSLLDETRGKQGHVLESLISLVGDLIESFESKTIASSAASPAEALRLLMESNSLTQADLANELGGQSVVSAILSGKRRINARQAGALGVRFAVSPALFIAPLATSPLATSNAVPRTSDRRLPMQVVQLTSDAVSKRTTADTSKWSHTRFVRDPVKRNTSMVTNEVIVSLQ